MEGTRQETKLIKMEKEENKSDMYDLMLQVERFNQVTGGEAKFTLTEKNTLILKIYANGDNSAGESMLMLLGEYPDNLVFKNKDYFIFKFISEQFENFNKIKQLASLIKEKEFKHVIRIE